MRAAERIQRQPEFALEQVVGNYHRQNRRRLVGGVAAALCVTLLAVAGWSRLPQLISAIEEELPTVDDIEREELLEQDNDKDETGEADGGRGTTKKGVIIPGSARRDGGRDPNGASNDTGDTESDNGSPGVATDDEEPAPSSPTARTATSEYTLNLNEIAFFATKRERSIHVSITDTAGGTVAAIVGIDADRNGNYEDSVDICGTSNGRITIPRGARLEIVIGEESCEGTAPPTRGSITVTFYK